MKDAKITEPCLIHDLKAETYHADTLCPEPSLSSSLAKKMFSETPLHAWTNSARLNPYFEAEEKDVFDIGTACHTVLTGHGPEIDIIEAEDWRTKAAKEAKEASRAAGRTPLLRKDYERVEAMHYCARIQLDATEGAEDAFRGQHPCEVSAFAQVGGVWCRARADELVMPGKDRRRGIIRDYKSTAVSIAPEDAARTIINFGYDLQAAHYLDTISAATGEAFDFQFIIQEKKPPHALIVVELPQEWLEDAFAKLRRIRQMWRWCLDHNKWPGYPAKIVVPDMPSWHRQRWVERQDFESAVKQNTGKDVLALGFQFQAPLEAAE